MRCRYPECGCFVEIDLFCSEHCRAQGAERVPIEEFEEGAAVCECGHAECTP